MVTVPELALKGVLSALLVAMAVCDLRTRLIPAWLTHPALVVAALGRALQGDVAAPLFLFAAFTDQWWQLPVVLFANVAAPSLSGYAADPSVTFAWLGILALWRAHVFGGGDAKLLMILFGLYPTVGLVSTVCLVSIGVCGLLLLRQRRQPRQLMRPAWPTAERLARQGQPLAFMYSLAGLLYLWLGV